MEGLLIRNRLTAIPGFDSQSLRHIISFHIISHQKTAENIGFLNSVL